VIDTAHPRPEGQQGCPKRFNTALFLIAARADGPLARPSWQLVCVARCSISFCSLAIIPLWKIPSKLPASDARACFRERARRLPAAPGNSWPARWKAVPMMNDRRMNWQNLESFSFGDSPELADELLSLVLEGKKRATCWAASEGLKGAAVGKSMVALDGRNRPRAVLKTIELTQRRFAEVDEAFARDEGEGDLSLTYWRDAHTRYFTRLGLFEPDMMLLCERFSVELVINP
jgi:uncharacterized protein YhfF